MIKLNIKEEVLIDWYFNTGSDQEQEDTAADLGNRVVKSLLKGETFNFSIDDLISEINMSCIPLEYFEEADQFEEDLEVGDLEGDVEVTVKKVKEFIV